MIHSLHFSTFVSLLCHGWLPHFLAYINFFLKRHPHPDRLISPPPAVKKSSVTTRDDDILGPVLELDVSIDVPHIRL